MNTKKLYESFLVLLSVVLLVTAGFSFYKAIDLTNKNTVVVIEEKPSVTVTDYKYYKFDNLSFGFILAKVEGKHIVDAIDLKDSMTSENTRFSSFVSFFDTMRDVGYKPDQISSVDILNNGTSDLFLVVSEPNQREYQLFINNDIKLKFDLSNPISDKTLFGFTEVPNEVPDNENPDEDPVNEDDVSTPIDVKQHDSVKLSNLVEVNLGSVLVLDGTKYVEMGYPSNTRVLVVPVTILKPGTVIKNATLKLVGIDASFSANSEKLKLDTTDEMNILNNGDLSSGLLFFEVNGAQYEITTFAYSLDFDIEGDQ